jgi:hypothetical protein
VEGKICEEGCGFEVRFGSENGERRAYLTIDYGHDNPGWSMSKSSTAR